MLGIARCSAGYFFEMACDKLSSFVALVRKGAIHAAFTACFGVEKVAPAFCPQHIEGAVAEKTIKFTRTYSLMAREVLATCVCEERFAIVHGDPL